MSPRSKRNPVSLFLSPSAHRLTKRPLQSPCTARTTADSATDCSRTAGERAKARPLTRTAVFALLLVLVLACCSFFAGTVVENRRLTAANSRKNAANQKQQENAAVPSYMNRNYDEEAELSADAVPVPFVTTTTAAAKTTKTATKAVGVAVGTGSTKPAVRATTTKPPQAAASTAPGQLRTQPTTTVKGAIKPSTQVGINQPPVFLGSTTPKPAQYIRNPNYNPPALASFDADSVTDWVRAPLMLGAAYTETSMGEFNRRLKGQVRSMAFNSFANSNAPGPAAAVQALSNLDSKFKEANTLGYKPFFMVTYESHCGLECLTDEVLQAIAGKVNQWAAEMPVILRFCHEMNGSWYAWGQRPAEYVAMWKRMHAAVKGKANGKRVSLLWAPNVAIRYPWPGQKYNHPVDPNQPFEPYWPGGQYVDLVGVSLYWYGNKYPYTKNELPPNDWFERELMAGNFYNRFAVQERKPVVIAETAATYYPLNPLGDTGVTEVQLKGAWIDQPFGKKMLQRFPLVKLVCWFENRKMWSFGGPSPQTIHDNQFTTKPEVVNKFLANMDTLSKDVRNPVWAAAQPDGYWLKNA
eukprot:GDKI01014183.1.p1 GENE.GDKI01014183.1~~GDKI01014183.1.p1  ORF type:complete len:581 (+),score=161.48 GDKI01014183.1:74-1816(+)